VVGLQASDQSDAWARKPAPRVCAWPAVRFNGWRCCVIPVYQE
jgi:hypothetical protein